MKKFIKALVVVLLVIAGVYFLHFSPNRKIDRRLVDKAIDLGTSYIYNAQRAEGNFVYEYDHMKQMPVNGNDSPVRQAGALWGLALSYNDNPVDSIAYAIRKGLDFFISNSQLQADGSSFIIYPESFNGKTGTMALVNLSLIDYLRTSTDSISDRIYYQMLNRYIKHIQNIQFEDKHIASAFGYNDGKPLSVYSNPYADGEVLLGFVKAAKYLGYDSLKPMALAMADAYYDRYVTKARIENPDSDQTKGFYQWSSMAFFEIYTAGWDDRYAERTIELAYWMIDTHKTLRRTKNTGYAYEGIVSAYELARLIGDESSQKKFKKVINKGLAKLMAWQIGSDVENWFLSYQNISNSKLAGGVLNYVIDPVIRIDVAQHQTHAMILARRYVYKKASK